MSTSWNVLIAAATAVVLVFMVLMFVSINGWVRAGLAAVLLAIAEIIRAVTGQRDRDRTSPEPSGGVENPEVVVPEQE